MMAELDGLIGNPDEMVTVAKFLDPVAAQMAKGMLESAGVGCFLVGEHANQMVSMAFRARLQVRREDEVEAKAMLAEVGEGLDRDGENS